MKTNPIAKTLQFIGYVGVLATIILLFITSSKQDSVVSDFTIIIGITVSFVTCMVFQGFAEIIELLYINGKKQETIIDFIFLNNKKQEELLKVINSLSSNDANAENTSANDFDIPVPTDKQ